jgi:hypothetical protein
MPARADSPRQNENAAAVMPMGLRHSKDCAIDIHVAASQGKDCGDMTGILFDAGNNLHWHWH